MADTLSYHHLFQIPRTKKVTSEQERVIYDTVYAFLSSTPDVCPFSVARPNFRTITGAEEGYFGALSANYLSGVIDKDRSLLHPDHASSVLGALDLGGSSTQVSLHTSTGGGSGSGGSGSVNAPDFFVHSYLGFGVEKMAEKYSAHLANQGSSHDPCAPPGFKVGSGSVVGAGHYGKCKAEIASALGLACDTADGR
jgi:hypothetical protein